MNKSQAQRPLNRAHNMHRDQIGRDGKIDKALVAAAPVIGQRRQTKGDRHPWLHGIALQDEPNIPLKTYETPAPIHPHMTPAQKANVHPVANSAKVILMEASTLGPKKPLKA